MRRECANTPSLRDPLKHWETRGTSQICAGEGGLEERKLAQVGRQDSPLPALVPLSQHVLRTADAPGGLARVAFAGALWVVG